jgi:pantetheine-phosphate adenylyltransferase
MANYRVGVYPGTFDPITLGHMDIIQRGMRLVDRLVIGVATNPGKGPIFDLEERIEMVRAEVHPLTEGTDIEVQVEPFSGLLVDFAARMEAQIVLRGLRSVTDFEYEFQMVGMNARLNPDVETVFLTASEKYSFIASRLVKEIAILGGEIGSFVTPSVAKQLYERVAKK